MQRIRVLVPVVLALLAGAAAGCGGGGGDASGPDRAITRETPAGTAAAGADRYVALGDSFSSGSGTGDAGIDRPCGRSRYAYPSLVARRRDLRLAFEACAGATTADVLATQTARLDRATRWVTITIGANDIRAYDVIATCVLGAPAGQCERKVRRARADIRARLPRSLDAVLRAITTRAPNATVIVLGYPRLFAARDCAARAPLSRATAASLNDAAGLLRDTLRSRARAAGPAVRFRDAIRAFAGHELCSRDPWLSGPDDPSGGSFHPNRAGHGSGYARLVLSAIR